MVLNRTSVSLFIVLALMPGLALAQNSPVLMKLGDVQVTAEDVERYVAFNLPNEDAKSVLGKPGNMDNYVRAILMMRTMARQAEAEGKGLDEAQLAWQIEFQKDTWLTGELQAHMASEALAEVEDWEAFAKEKYIAESERFRLPNKVDAAHILIKTEDRTEKEAVTLIEELRQRALDGEDFNELAREYSDDPSADKNAGELGEFEARRMVPEFSQAAFALVEPGDISEPVKSQFGYHIIKLNERIDGGRQPFDLVKRTLINELEKKRRSEVLNHYIGSLRTETLKAEPDVEALNQFREKYGLSVLSAEDAATIGTTHGETINREPSQQ